MEIVWVFHFDHSATPSGNSKPFDIQTVGLA